MDLAVFVTASVGPLHEPVAGDAGVGQGAQALERIVAASVARRHLARRDAAARIALALVEARSADQAERRSFGQVRRALAVVGDRLQVGRFIDAVNPLVGNQGARPLLVKLRIVLDEQHLAGFVDQLARLDQIDAAVDGRLAQAVVAVDRARRPDRQEVIVRRAGRMSHLADARRVRVLGVRKARGRIEGGAERGQPFQLVGTEGNAIVTRPVVGQVARILDRCGPEERPRHWAAAAASL